MSLINKKRILCIEDDQDTCDLLAAALRVSGYEAVFAHTLADGITLARSEPFALYLPG